MCTVLQSRLRKFVFILKAMRSQVILKVVFLLHLLLFCSVANRQENNKSDSRKILLHNTILGHVREENGLDKDCGAGAE